MSIDLSPYRQVFRSKRIALMLLLGFSSGLPLALTGATLQAWMAVEGVDLKTIGAFALVGLPYALKFAWSPLMDRFVPPWLGRRRGWMVLTQISLGLGIAAMSFSSPTRLPLLVALIALFVAFASASQDIVIDAYRTDILAEKERGVGAAVFVMGYRLAMLISGALALILSDRIGWQATYLLMAALMSVGVLSALWGGEPRQQALPPQSLTEAVGGPWRDFFSRPRALALMALIILYKLGDAYAGSMTTAFLIKGIGFSASEVGTINKGLGLISLLIGALYGGALMVKFGLYRSLLSFGVLQMVSNLSFMLLAWAGKSLPLMIFAIGFENLCGGMGTAAFVALLMALCTQRYSATQYALLSSLAALGRIVMAPSAGFLIERVGWAHFFLVTTLIALPGLWLLRRMRATIAALSGGAGQASA